MFLKHLQVSHFRNLKRVSINPSPGINIIYGNNASGKTSLLESIFVLGRGRSFRGTRNYPLIHKGESKFQVFGKFQITDGLEKRIGVQREGKVTEVRVNQEKVKTISELAKDIPFQIITTRSHEILERGPQYRRRFMDWGVFHVEPQFHHWYLRYKKALNQRNACLRTHQSDVTVWTTELVTAANVIDNMRVNYLNRFIKLFAEKVSELPLADLKLAITFNRGWNSDLELEEVLSKSQVEDRKRGYTFYGPHRANYSLKTTKGEFSALASEGQKKLVMIILCLTQNQLLKEITGKQNILLVDDLPAEFDPSNRELVLRIISKEYDQIFITSTEPSLLKFKLEEIPTMFHVEQGSVSSISQVL